MGDTFCQTMEYELVKKPICYIVQNDKGGGGKLLVFLFQISDSNHGKMVTLSVLVEDFKQFISGNAQALSFCVLIDPELSLGWN